MTDVRKELRCPICHSAFGLSENGRSLVCTGEKKKHCFDLAASGYVNFAPPAKNHSGDPKEAVRSRTEFLDKGFYAPIRDAVCEKVAARGGFVIDAGCGEGYYSCGIAAYCEALVGFDLSKVSIEAAAKRAHREGTGNAFFAVSGIYDMPLDDCSADAVVSIFAPCAEEEFSRVLKNDGLLVVVGAGEDHLLGLKKAVYETTYKNTERVDMPSTMRLLDEQRVAYTIELCDNKSIMDLFSMTPYSYRTGEGDIQKLRELEKLTTEVDVTVRVYQKVRNS